RTLLDCYFCWIIDLTMQISTFFSSLNDKIDPSLQEIASKVVQKERISDKDALLLFEKAPLSFVGSIANYIREQKHGDKTYFNRNFHIEPTNVCIYTCNFCSYSRLIKKRDEGWEYSMEDMLDIVK